ncbi:MAG: zinc metalloprotease HtpX [Candidatus Aenigmatarchaeota archaeon]|nr:M48 family metalloprotease [Candidatus Aenigmarchaeota archaeon]
MLLFIDPLYILLGVIGYVLMFFIASFIAPKVASKFAGKFSLFASMIILSSSILIISGTIIYLVLAYAEVYIDFILLVVFVFISNFLIYLISPFMINLSYGAKQDNKLQEIVDEVAKKLKVKKKFKAMQVEMPPNAFAYGNFLTGRFVAVSTSLANMVDKEELEAIIGHEIGHHKHRDVAIMLIFGILPSIIYYLGYSMIRSSFWRRSDEERRGSSLFLIGFLLVLASFFIQILVLAFSRLREYYADYEGAKATSKRAMQSALVRIYNFYYESPRALNRIRSEKFRTLFTYSLVEAVASPYVSLDEIERIKKKNVSPIQEFMSTHPPIPKRLMSLESFSL